MKLYSTQHSSPEVTFKQAVFKGLPPDNGLYLPTYVPVLPESFFEKLEDLTIGEIGFEVSKVLIGDEIEPSQLRLINEEAFNFPISMHRLKNANVLELYHGPTLAFKDFGARFMSRVMNYFLRNEDKKTTILVATSGDTGGAVADGFLGVDGIDVMILYPAGKVSELQERQLTTLGQNVTALKIDGTFDDCQALVKKAFLDHDLNLHLNLSSANSINICRMLPQSFYYFYAAGKVGNDRPLVFSVPSGNLGNLSGGLLAQKLGLSVDKFIAASNVNSTFPLYLQSGEYVPRQSVETISNAMDVGNPSNFARINDWFNVDEIGNKMCGYYFDDDQTREAIREVYHQQNYLLCPHSAVGYLGLQKYNPAKEVNGIVLSTAHPAKFADTIEPIIGDKLDIPEVLERLKGREKLFSDMPNNYLAFKEFLMSQV